MRKADYTTLAHVIRDSLAAYKAVAMMRVDNAQAIGGHNALITLAQQLARELSVDSGMFLKECGFPVNAHPPRL